MNLKSTSSSVGKWLLAASLVLGADIAGARQLSQDEALQRAMNSMQSSTSRKAPALNKGNITLAYKAANPKKADQQYFYLFNTGADKGFIIAGADDRVAPVLGYSDNGTADMDNLPPNMKWWLDEYQRQIQWMYDHPENYTSEYKAPSRAATASIEPIVKAKWNQGTPYNNLCPMDGDNRSLTGCVATAIAQIMHHHKWPKVGRGENSYECSQLGGTVSATFEGTVYDWDNMLDEYTSEWVPDGAGNYIASPLYSETAANAVATLMYHCGVACNMSYSASGSGASDWDAKNALVNYFSYDPETMYIYSPTDFTYDETCTKIIAELQANRPVYFSGQSNTGGHAFVLDGWNEEGKAHINWGWGGSYDGYFLISALDPYGNNNGYNDYQIFICGIQPPGASAVAPYPEFYGEGNFTWFTDDNGENAFKADEGVIYNKSNSTHDFTFTLRFEYTSSNDIKYMKPQGPISLDSGYGFYDIADQFFYTHAVKDGIYKVYLSYKVDDSQEWHKVRFVPYETSRQFIYAVVENGTVTYSNEAPEVEPTEATILVSDWEYASLMNPNSLNPISFTITNTSDKLTFSQTLLASFYQKDGGINWVFEDIPVELRPLESKKFEIVFGDGEYDKEQKNGEFELCLINEKEKLFSDRLPVTIDSEYTEKDPAFEGSNLNYNILSEEDRTCEVIRGDYEGDIIIPEKTIIDGKTYTVTRIGQRAFEYDVTSLHIPKTILEIYEYSMFPQFLTKFSIDSENPNFAVIDDVLFNKDITKLIAYPAYKDPEGHYTIPSSVNTVGYEAFHWASLKSVDIPQSVIKLEQEAFAGSSLKSVSIHNLDLEIARYAFIRMRDCEAFDIETSNHTSKDGVLYSKDKTKLIQYSCGSKATSFTVPEGVKIIDEYGFDDAINLTEVNLPESLEEIKIRALEDMYHLEKVLIPNKVKIIWHNAFWRCPAIKLITIGKSVEKIYWEAFISSDPGANNQPNPNLTEVISLNPIPPTIIESSATGSGAFHPTDCENVPLYVPYGCKEAYAAADGWKQFATIIELPQEDTDIFRPLDDGTCEMIGLPDDFTGELVIPSTAVIDGVEYNVTAIAPEAFKDCTDITSVVIGANITTIGKDAFAGCTGITSVTIGDRTIHLGRTSTESGIAIEGGAFAGCDAITTVTCWYEVPPVITDDTFTDVVYRNAELIVPHAEPYAEAIGWRNFRTMTSGINGVNGDEVKVKVDGNSINIEGVADATIEVFNLSGALIYSGTEPRIDNLAAGLYIVRIGSYSTKVAVK